MVLVGLWALDRYDVGDPAQLGAVVLLLVRGLTYGQNISSSMQLLAEQRPYLLDLQDFGRNYRTAAVTTGGVRFPSDATVHLDEVTFAYGDGPLVLDGVSFAVEPGETIGIVGPSGSGKSTLLHILLRLHRPRTGTYAVGGVEVDDIDAAEWGRCVAFVPQQNLLLSGTVADNVRFFRPGIAADDVAAALRGAHLDDLLASLDDGAETVVGPGAHDISGGQLQRLGLARALVGRPKLLVLDEPTSALDMQSERAVQETLTGLRGSMAMVIVAHRISTLSICDRILVLRDGGVEAFGTHDELLAASDFYRAAVTLARLPS
jgi:ABC-type multidrug transport system fused ATPase/permease subunit